MVKFTKKSRTSYIFLKSPEAALLNKGLMLSSSFRCDQIYRYKIYHFGHTFLCYLSQTLMFNKPTSVKLWSIKGWNEPRKETREMFNIKAKKLLQLLKSRRKLVDFIDSIVKKLGLIQHQFDSYKNVLKNPLNSGAFRRETRYVRIKKHS